jgi:uncharacterized membrane protein YjjP (DUF1212 family)
MLREYLDRFGLPEEGGPRQQEMVLREALRDLYGGGTPLWALESTMQKAAEGLTGDRHVNWMILPRKAFVFAPSSLAAIMFQIERGFSIRKLEAMEPIVIRLASFASNTTGTGNVPSRFPDPIELRRAFRAESLSTMGTEPALSREEVAKIILTLASEAQGIFFYINSRGYLDKISSPGAKHRQTEVDNFWLVSDQERQLFTRLATIEAVEKIDEIDTNEAAKVLFPPYVILLFRFLASAGACAFWFGGSWPDMVVAGILANIVASIGTNKILSKQEKVVYETVASFVVGLVSALIALKWPDKTCYRAMALAGVLDILQGFRVVYAVIQTMSKHTVAGGADLFEGILFSGLIVTFLRIGQYAAINIMDVENASSELSTCNNSVSEWWYILMVPIASLSWSGLFNPNYSGWLPMTFHGCLAFAVNFGMGKLNVDNNLNNFVSALAVTFSAGIFSRFTGRQAVGNAVCGLYVVLPGAYLVSSLYSTDLTNDFFAAITVRSVVIGIGAWTGSILCSPTVLGTTRGLSTQQTTRLRDSERSRKRSSQPATMLFF